MQKKLVFIASSALFAITGSACNSEPAVPDTTEVISQEPVQELIAETAIGRSDFGAMKAKNGAYAVDMSTDSPDLLKNGSLLSLPPGGSIEFISADKNVKASDEFQASVWLWRDGDTLNESETSSVALQIVRWCSITEPEVKTENFAITDEPTKYTLSYTFENDHDCALFKLVGVNSGATVFAWDAALTRLEKQQ